MASTVYNPNTMSKSEVKKMQQALVDAGYSVGSAGVDGVWGKDTAAALSQFKADNGRTNTNGNSVGDATFNILYNTGGSNTSTKPATASAPASPVTASSAPASNWYYIKTDDQTVKNTLNQAASLLQYDDLSGYIPGQDINKDYWASTASGGAGGKNALFGNDKNYKATAWTNYDYLAAKKVVDDYNARIAAEAEAKANAEREAYWSRVESAMNSQYAAQQDAIKQNTQATIDSINSNKQGINDEYEKAAKENYINSVLQKNQTNDYMQAMGYNGGMTETSLAGINANYENNRANALSERDAALREIERLVAEAQATGNTDLANAASNYYNSYVSALQNQMQMDYQISQDQQAQANADRDYQLQLQQIALNQQQYNDEKTEQSKQQIAANDFETFLNTYQGKYNKQATYEKWIENLKKMDDPYGYNKAKIAYLTQYINSGMGKSTGSSGGGGGDKPIYNPTPKAPVANYDDVRYTAVAMISNNSIYGPGNAAEYIKSSGLSDIEKEKLYRELGLL